MIWGVEAAIGVKYVFLLGPINTSSISAVAKGYDEGLM
jgi:hypothetical protein